MSNHAVASAVMALAILALGTFSAGVYLASCRICAVGAVLGLGVSIIAWFEQTTAVFLFLAAAGAALLAFSAFRHRAAPKQG